MKDFYLGIKFSFSYFSTLPAQMNQNSDLLKKEILNIMLLFLPMVGYVLGLGTILVFSFFSHLEWFGALISAVVYMLFYGFIHTKAIIDVFDAIYAKNLGKDVYKVIREPTVGAIGVLYGVSFLLLKVAGITMMFTHNLLTEFLAIVIISRLSLLSLIVLHDFNSLFLTQLKESLDLWFLMMLFIVATIMGSFLISCFTLLLLVGLISGFLISIMLAKKLGFANGDVLSATLEGVELTLFIFIIFLRMN